MTKLSDFEPSHDASCFLRICKVLLRRYTVRAAASYKYHLARASDARGGKI
ncbi:MULTISPECIES: hypothetical protein [Bradyrhizobium]|uniref:hypothetical protein n=1 Tax=Bradyrhizobium TaxID=374 RepID=UPI00155E7B7F|nr:MULTISPECIES: hypothetical protein [Bradyrhizobium]